MPKIVDHEARRAELAAALWRVIVRDGIDAASVRHVAAEAGCSPSSLRHYFASQEQLHAFALERALHQCARRLARVLEQPAADRLDQAVAVLETLLPLDEERTAEVLVWLAFGTGVWRLSNTVEVRDRVWAESAYLARLAVAAATGETVPTGEFSDPALEFHARRLQVLVDGWCVQAIMYPEVSAERLRREARAELEAIVAAR